MTDIDHIAASTWHGRVGDTPNAFTYSIDYVLTDAEAEDAGPAGFGRNRGGLMSLHDSDHGGPPKDGRGAAWVREVLEAHGLPAPERIELLAQPRVLGHVFNPVSFYYCFDESGTRLQAVVSEITNTPWLERHSYVTDQRPDPSADSLTHQRFEKSFHVSPFFKMDHTYDWGFSEPTESLSVWMQNFSEGRKVFEARLSGERLEWNRKNMTRVLLRNPCVTLAGWLGIYWQAAKLRLKGIPYIPHPDTLNTQDSDQEKAEIK